ncbi:hypothetical protein ACWDTP_25510 [Mycobacterium sp. NPDC003449]
MSGRHSFRAVEQAGQDRSEDGVDDTAAEEVDADEETTDEVADETVETDEAPETDEADEPAKPADQPARRIDWPRVVVFAVLPALALLLAAGSAFLKWQVTSGGESQTTRTESVEAAKDITTQMLSYEPDSVEQHLNAVRDRMTGDFLDTYTDLINTAVIPGATAQQVTAAAEVLAAGSVDAGPDRAEVMLFLNQTVVIASQPPQRTASTVQATMVRDGDRWLMSEFAPVKP